MALGDKKTPTYDDILRRAVGFAGVGENMKQRMDDEVHQMVHGKPKKRADPESQLQRALIESVRVWDGKRKVWMPGPLVLDLPDLMDLYAVPNGGKRGAGTAAKMKAEGVMSGVWDLHLPVPINGAIDPIDPRASWKQYHGLYLETKTPTGRLTPEQRSFGQRMVQRGYACAVYRTLGEGQQLLRLYMRGLWIQEPGLFD